MRLIVYLDNDNTTDEYPIDFFYVVITDQGRDLYKFGINGRDPHYEDRVLSSLRNHLDTLWVSSVNKNTTVTVELPYGYHVIFNSDERKERTATSLLGK